MNKFLVDTNLTGTELHDYHDLYTESIKNAINDYAHGKKGSSILAEREYIMTKFAQSKAELPDEVTVLPKYDIEKYIAKGYKTVIADATRGNDATADGSEEKPYLTFSAALNACAGEGYALLLREGSYYVSGAELDEKLSGSTDNPFIIASFKNEKAEFTSSRKLSAKDFCHIDAENDEIASRIPKEAQQNVVVANLRDLGWTDEQIGSITRASRPSMFINGRQTDIARFPHNTGNEADLLYFDQSEDTGSVISADGSRLYALWKERVKNWDNRRKFLAKENDSYNWDTIAIYAGAETHLYKNEEEAIRDAEKLQDSVNRYGEPYIDSFGNMNLVHPFTIKILPNTLKQATHAITQEDIDKILSWKSIADGRVMMRGSVYEGWEFAHYFIRSMEKREDGLVSLTANSGSTYGAAGSTNSPTGHNMFYIYNAPEAIGIAGEWYLDEKSGKLYVYKTDDFDTAEIDYVTSNSNLLTVKADNVIISDITFKRGLQSAIQMQDNSNCVVQSCEFSGFRGFAAVHLSDTVRCAVIYNDLHDNYARGIRAYAHSHKVQVPSFNVIQNNHIYSPINNQGGISAGGFRNVISHNTLEETQIGVEYGYESIVEFNDILGGSQTISDAGLIYMTGYFVQGNHIRYNFLHTWHAAGKGIYFDDLNLGNYAYGNIIDTAEAPGGAMRAFIYTSSGHNHVMSNNFCIGRSKLSKQIITPDGKRTETVISGVMTASAEEIIDGMAVATITLDGKPYSAKVPATDDKASITYFGTVENAYGYKSVEIYYVQPTSDSTSDQFSLIFEHEDGIKERYASFSDRINRSWLYFSDGCWLGYRFKGRSQEFYKNFSEYAKAGTVFSKRFPEIENFTELVREHIDEREKEGYQINPLEIYIRSIVNIILTDNIVLGVPRSYYGPKPSAHAQGVDAYGNPVIYKGDDSDYINGFFDIESSDYKEIKDDVTEYQNNPNYDSFIKLFRKAEALQKKNNENYYSLEFVLEKAGIVK